MKKARERVEMHARVVTKSATVTNKSAYNYRNDFGRKIAATDSKAEI